MTIDFMTNLPKCHAYGQIYDVIFMIINCLSKERHYILCSKDNKGMSVKATVKLFMQHVWLRKGLPISPTSDRGLQFVAKMWDLLCKLLDIKLILFTAWHSKINDQSEIANQEIKRYFRSYVNYFQDNWV